MILASAKKEFIIIARDFHALAVLLLMPLVFLIIMSLAMPDATQAKQVRFSIAIVSSTDTIYSQSLRYYLQNNQAIEWHYSEQQTLTYWQQQLAQKQIDAIVSLPDIDDAQSLDITKTTVYLDANFNYQNQQLLDAALLEALGKTRLFMFYREMNGASTQQELQQWRINAQQTTQKDHIEHQFSQSQLTKTPSSVQQSVPAWLVFGMFFILIPLSNTLIQELQQGTLQRLRTMNVSSTKFLIGKLLPYFVINQLQFVLMLLAGCYLIPLLGGQALLINGTMVALLAMSICCSFAALAFAMVIAVFAKTSELATALGGGITIIFAAIGGIMIPKYIMPPTMQLVTAISPMSWALDGFLEIILYGHSFASIIYPCIALVIFACVSFLAAVMRFHQLTRYGYS